MSETDPSIMLRKESIISRLTCNHSMQPLSLLTIGFLVFLKEDNTFVDVLEWD